VGYDMRWITKSEGEEEAVAQAQKEFYAACDARDRFPRESQGRRDAQEDVDRTYAALNKADRSYFRFNVWGMSKVVGAMMALGAAYDGYADDRPPWPEYPDGYWDWQEKPEGDWTAEQVEVFRAYEKASQEVRDWSPPGGLGIPCHKFSTNDGWHVLPEEAFYAASTIRAAEPETVAEALRAAGMVEDDWPEYWAQWVQWLADSSEYGGFEVH
jgi:hypothetical protein